jgi:hypothetical protein
MNIEEISNRLRQEMMESFSGNLGPDYSLCCNQYDDLYRIISMFSMSLNGNPFLPFEEINRDNVFEIIKGVNDYFKQILEYDEPFFDQLYEFFKDTWDWEEES